MDAIVGTIIDVNANLSPTDKDLELGLKTKLLVERKVSLKIGEKEFTETLLYTVKLKDLGPLKVGDKVVVEGRAYDFEGRRGVSQAKVMRLA